MKKVLVIAVCIICACIFAGCGNKNDNNNGMPQSSLTTQGTSAAVNDGNNQVVTDNTNIIQGGMDMMESGVSDIQSGISDAEDAMDPGSNNRRR